jgi:PAS domain S-box-containing protein
MPAAPTPPQEEAERLRALHDYGVLDTPPEAAFDELVALAARICGTPISLVSLIDENRQWFKAHHGLTLTETPRAVSFCPHVLSQPGELLIVPDANRDSRFTRNPFVTGEPGIRFYAGVLLRTPEGHAVGTLCVMDRQPRTLSPDQQEALRVLGRQVMAQMELHRSLHEAALNSTRLENSQRIAGLGDWEHDFVNHRLLWSDEVYRILGLSRKDNPPDSAIFYRQVHPDDLAFVHREKKAAAEDFRRVDFEHRIIRPGGEVRYIHHIAEMIFDDQGRPVRESGTLQDITERKLAGEALRQSEERYRLMFERNPSPMWVFDPKTLEFLAVNEAATALYGYSREEFLRLNARDIRPPEAVPDFLLRMAAAPLEFRAAGRYLHRKKDGTVFPVDTLAHGINFAGRPARLVLAVDMTEPERAVVALRVSEARFRALSESAPIGIFEFDAEGSCIYHNPALAALTGRSLEQNLGQGWKNAIHPEDRAATRADWERAASARQTWSNEHRLLRPDGSVRWVHTLAAPSKDAGGRITGFVGTKEDITERKRAEEIVREASGHEARSRRKRVYIELAILATGAAAIYLLAARFNWFEAATRWVLANELQQLDETILATIFLVVGLAVFAFRRWRESESELTGGQQTQVALGLMHDELEQRVKQRTAELANANQALQAEVIERQRGEAALLQQQSELRVLFDLMPAMVWFKDTENRILRVNQRVADTAGKPVEEIEGKPSLEIYPQDAARYYADDLKVIRSGSPQLGIVETLRDPAGHELWVQTDKVPYRDKDGKVIGIVVMAQDITARKAGEAALRESEERFKFVARAVSDAIWDWNIAVNTVWWNEGFFTAFGYTAGEIQPSHEAWTSRIHPDERPGVVASIHAAIASDVATWGAEYRFQRKDGSYAAVQDRGYILRDAAGRGVRMVGGLRDLTEQKKMEAQFLRAQRMDSIGTLAGGIAHDLNNVLAPILMSIELLKLDPANDPARSKMLDTIMLSCRRGADLVRQVLSFARGLDGQRVAVRLRHLVDDLEGMISETFPRNIQIVSEVPNGIWPVTGDPTQLHQVLLNLAVNARDAMPHGGILTLAASNVTFDAQYAGTSHEAKPGPHVLLRVTDTGMGIAPEVRDRIFEPFFTTKGVGEGTGIGLATVHAIVKSHGGFITVESVVGHGTTFTIHLPADPALRSHVTQHPFTPVELPGGHGELVLVVDDESSIREITQQTLEAFGYKVIVATNGAEAVALYAMQAPTISAVLTDMMMPIMDGAAVIKVILRINPAARIIAASGIDSKDAVTKAGIAGVKHFLAKPYTAETLLLLLREVIDTPAAPARGQPLPRS